MDIGNIYKVVFKIYWLRALFLRLPIDLWIHADRYT